MSRSKIVTEQTEDDSDAGFVPRWSRLKHASREGIETTAGENMTTSALPDEKNLSGQHAASSAIILTDGDMPGIETLTPDSVYADFLSPGVSEKLRKRALRKLFHFEAFNIRDGLDEYDDDYTQFEKLGDIVTSDMRHQFDLEAQRQAQRLLQEKEQLHDRDSEGEKGVNDHGKPLVEDNITESVSETEESIQIDETQTLTFADAGDQGLLSDYAQSVDPAQTIRPENRLRKSDAESENDTDENRASDIQR